MASDDPPYLAVGTEVSAKYKGAFCESVVKKIDKNVKCKVTFKVDNKAAIVSDEDIKGQLRVGSVVEVLRNDSFFEATINRITDHSIYHVLFDDGDENSLKRSKLCPKGDRHFTKSTTLDVLPLNHPEHFGSPVIKRDPQKRNLNTPNRCSDSEGSISDANGRSDDELETNEDFFSDHRQDLIGRIVFATAADEKGGRKGPEAANNMMVPLLVVLSGADGNQQSNNKILTKSFKDSKFMSFPLNGLKCLTLDDLQLLKDKCPKIAIDRASAYLQKNELPASWDRSDLIGCATDDEDDEDDDDDDDDYNKRKSSEMRDRFVAELYRFMEERGSPINCAPTISGMELDLYKLFHLVQQLGGNNKVTNQSKWHVIHRKMNFDYAITLPSAIKSAYKKYLYAFEDLDRKLGRTSWSNKASIGSRSIVSFRDREHDQVSSGRNHRNKTKKEESDRMVKQELLKVKADSVADDSAKLSRHPKRKVSDEESSNDEQTTKEPRQRIRSAVPPKPDQADPKKKSALKSEEADQSELVKGAKTVLKDAIKRHATPKPKEKTDVEDKEQADRAKNKSEHQNKKLSVDAVLSKAALPKKPDGRYKEQKLNRGREREARKVKDGTSDSISSKEGRNDGDADEDGRKKCEDGMQGPSMGMSDRSTRRMLRRGYSNEATKEDLSRKPNLETTYLIGTRLKVKYGDGNNEKIYKAKILESKTRNGCIRYLVHYSGWNSRYDQWIYPDKIVEILEEPIGDQEQSQPHNIKSLRSTDLNKGRSRLNRYGRLSSSETTSSRADDDNDHKGNKRGKHFGDSNADSDSDSNNENSNDLNFEKNKKLKCKKSSPEGALKNLEAPSSNIVDDPLETSLPLLIAFQDEKLDIILKNNEDCKTDCSEEVKLKELPTLYLSNDNVIDGQLIFPDVATDELLLPISSEEINVNLLERNVSPVFPKKIFQNSAFTLKTNKEIQKIENRSVWRDDGGLNVNLIESPIKKDSPLDSISPTFSSFAIKTSGDPTSEGAEKGVEEALDYEGGITYVTVEGGKDEESSPPETGSSEEVGAEENASTKSDREANREVEAYMTADYTNFDRKADYVMLNRLPGETGSYYVPSLDDSSDASSTGRIACPKPILPHPFMTGARKGDSNRKRKKKKVPTATLR